MTGPSALCPVISCAAMCLALLPRALQGHVSALAPLGMGGYNIVLQGHLQAATGSSASGAGSMSMLVKPGPVAIKIPFAQNEAATAAVEKEAGLMRKIAADPVETSQASRNTQLSAAVLGWVESAMVTGSAGALATVAESRHRETTPSLGQFSFWDHVPELVDSSASSLVVRPVGQSLHERLTRCGSTAARVALLQMALPGILRALVHCHARGVEHQDVRAANIILVPGLTADAGDASGSDQEAERAVLIDFGLARVRPGADSTMFGARDVVGLVLLCQQARHEEWTGHHARLAAVSAEQTSPATLAAADIADIAKELDATKAISLLDQALALAPGDGDSSPADAAAAAGAAAAGGAGRGAF